MLARLVGRAAESVARLQGARSRAAPGASLSPRGARASRGERTDERGECGECGERGERGSERGELL